MRKRSASIATRRDAPHPVSQRRDRGQWIVALLFFATCAIIIAEAWVSDDAYISLRTVENFVRGHGLVWNAGERVQAFTNPLWVLVLSAFCFFTDEYYLTTIVVSAVLSIAAVWFLLRLSPSTWTSKAAALLGLGLSVAFVSYTTSGLENPLTFFLMSLFLLAFWKQSSPEKRLLLMGVFGSLSMVNRLDNVFLFGIPMLCAFLKEPRWRARRLLLAGSTPIVAWTAFALIYYGSILPNSAIAKLYTGVSRAEYLRQGMLYFGDALLYEPLTLIGIFWGVGAAFARRGRDFAPLGIGIVLNLLYVVWVGGDFMRGRFLVATFFMSIAILLRTEFLLPSRLRPWAPIVVLLLSIPTLDRAFLVGDEREPLLRQRAKTGIGDERAFYPESRLRRSLRNQVGYDMTSTRRFRAADPARVRLVSTAGRSGFMSGPAVYVIDSYALTNPLMSRIAVRDDRAWRIGHFQRPVPEGYLSSLLLVGSGIADPSIRELYTKIQSATRGPLFAARRWKNVIDLNNPFGKKVFDLQQDEFVEPSECVALAKTRLEVLDLQLLWGAAQVEIMAGNLESGKHVLRRMFEILQNRPQGFYSRRDYVVEVTELAKRRSTERFEDAEDLLLFAIAETPNRKEPLLGLAELYEHANREHEAAVLRDRAAGL